MSATGSHTVARRSASDLKLSSLVAWAGLFTADTGQQITWPEWHQALDRRQAAATLRDTAQQRLAAARQQVVDLGETFTAGDLSADQLVDAAATATPLIDPTTARTAVATIDATAARIEAAAMPALLAVTEARWLKLIGPTVTERLAAAHAAADEVGINQPRILQHRTPGGAVVVRGGHPWSPDPGDLARDLDLRHAWERLDANLVALDNALGHADVLRDLGLLPVVDGRTRREDYHWLRPDKLSGSLDPTWRREFWLANRHHADAGLYSAKQMQAADAEADAEQQRQPVGA